MKKKVLIALSYVLIVALAITGTVAYLTDTDEAVNVMTLGKVEIKQVELERVEQTNSGNDELQDFNNNKPLYPAVGEINWVETTEGRVFQKWPTGGSSALFDADLKNVQDKFVFVENTGKSDAYVRTWFAFEAGNFTAEEMNNGKIHWNRNGNHWSWTDFSEDMVATIGGVKYYLRVATYTGNAGDNQDVHKNGVLPAGETTRPSLLQVFLDSEVDNADIAALGDSYEILVFSQAVQTNGFDDPTTALNAGFDEAIAANHPWKETTVEDDNTITLTNGETARLIGESEAVTVSGKGTLVLSNATIEAETNAVTVAAGSDVELVVTGNTTLTGKNGIYVEEDAKVEITGANLTAIGGNGEDTANGGSGIGGAGEIYIHDLADLTAEGYGRWAFGIGGSDAEVTIEDTNITYVRGGYANTAFSDEKYAKDAEEGGAGIGGKVINLTDVTIEKVEGGSKAAGIGAMYWDPVTVNITNCTIKSAIGGTSAAGIGGSRIHSGDAKDQAVNITIVDSDVTAVGGYFGAGIGSGYDTHCHTPDVAPICTINIKGNSVINATGGKYAAGIGTGYHAGGLAGEIESTVTVTAVSGEKFYKDTYTKAQDIGFGVLDPTRDGLNNTCTITYKGAAIGVPAVN